MVTPGFPLGQPPHERGRLRSMRSWPISRAIPRVASTQTVAMNTRVFLSRHGLKQAVPAIVEIELAKKPSRRSLLLTREEGPMVLTSLPAGNPGHPRIPTSNVV